MAACKDRDGYTPRVRAEEIKTLTLVETLTFHGQALTRTLVTVDQVEILREHYPISPFVLVLPVDY